MPSLQSFLANNSAFKTPLTADSPLPALYADLSAQRASNPAAFSSNVAWWGTTLADAALAGALGKSGDRCVLHVEKDASAEWENEEVGRPLGLGTAVVSAERAGRGGGGSIQPASQPASPV